MARVQVSSEAWGYVVDLRGRPRANALCAIDTTVYANSTGGTTISPASWVTDDEGLLPGWVEPGRYTFTEPDSDTRTVIAGGGYQTVRYSGSDMAKRETLVFEGDAVEVQDDSGNDRTRVIVEGTPGATGPPGEVFGVDVWDQEASPGSVTDWGPTINTLIDNGAKRLLFRAEDFPFSTGIDPSGVNGLVFEGMSGLVWDMHSSSGSGGARLLWTGTGSGRAVDCRSGDGITFTDLHFDYDDGGYTGKYFDLGTLGGANPPSSFITFHRCALWCTHDHVTAAAWIATDQAVMPVIRNCSISGAAVGIRGYETAGTVAGNDMVVADTMMYRNVVHLMNPGINWRINDVTFQMNHSDTLFAIDSDITYAGSQKTDIWLTRCTFWDFDVDTQMSIRQKTTNPGDWVLTDCYHQGTETVAYDFLGPGSVILRGGTIDTSVPVAQSYAVDFGDSGTSPSGVKDMVVVEGINVGGASGGIAALTNLDGGHRIVRVWTTKTGSGPPVQQVHTQSGQVRNAYIGDSGDFNGSCATSAGQSNISAVGMFGNEREGIIWARTTGGGASATGDLIDITFANPLIPGIGGISGLNRSPLIHLTPIVTDANDTGTVSGSASAACHVYGKVAIGTYATAKIGIGVAIPTSTTVAWAYQIGVL